MGETKVCSRCVMDSDVPDIEFDDNGICNYCAQFDALCGQNPNDAQGAVILENIIRKIKRKSAKRTHDVIVGISGGVDSIYLIAKAKELGLRPLAVHLDNGWDSEIAVGNIRKALEHLQVDLETYVIHYEEIKDILLSFMKASLPWIDAPTDMAIMSSLYEVAARRGIPYIFVGNNFRTEGKQPTAWTYCDGRQVKYIQKHFGTKKIRSFPNLTAWKLIWYGAIRKIKLVRPLYYIPYHKEKAKEMLAQNYGWRDYGGHHHENIFTKFAIGNWLANKHGIDKRKVTWSALVRSGEMNRGQALEKLKAPHYDPGQMEEDRRYVIKKLGITEEEFSRIWKLPNRGFRDYPSYYPLYIRFTGLFGWAFRYLLPFKPMMTYKLNKKD